MIIGNQDRKEKTN